MERRHFEHGRGEHGRSCRQRSLRGVDDLGAAAVLGGFATAGMFSHLLPAAVDPSARDDLHATLDRARTNLGDETFRTETARGAAMSSDDVLLFIRQTADTALSN